MKKILAALLITSTLAGCATGPERGHYYKDENGQTQYEPSAEAKNADRWATTGAVLTGLAAAAAITLGVIGINKH